ncbi:MAG: LamG domain-containing protein, partial [Verrucomicrobiota bacterium]
MEFDRSIPNLYARMASPVAGDLRFTDESLTNEIAHDIESWDTNGSSVVWVRHPAFSNNACIYAYWGNPLATNFPVTSTNGAVWNQHFDAVWHLDETSGQHFDATAAEHVATPQNGVMQDAVGIANGANLFDGLNDWVLGANIPFATAGNYAVSAWINTEGNEDQSFLAATIGNTHGILVEIGAGVVRFLHRFPLGNGGGTSIFSGPGYNDGGWHHVMATKSSSNMTLYIDGAPVATGADATSMDTGRDVVFGRLSSAQTLRYFDGHIDEVRVSSEVPSTNWIRAVWKNIASNDTFNTFGPQEVLFTNRPVINALPVAGVTDMSAIMNGELVSTGAAETVITLYHGTSDQGANPFLWEGTNTLGTNMAAPPVPYAVAVGSLSVETPYFYRFFATNALGVWWSDVQQFGTRGPPILSNGVGATGLGPGMATLNGELLNETPSDITFYSGPVDGGTVASAWASSNHISFQNPGPFSGVVSGLIYGVHYYYRVFGTHLYGSGWSSASATFKTPRPAGLPNPAVSNTGLDSVTTTSAVFHARFNGADSLFHVEFHVGTTDGGNDPLAWSNTISVGIFTNLAASNFSVYVDGLMSNTVYFYRFSATNC